MLLRRTGFTVASLSALVLMTCGQQNNNNSGSDAGSNEIVGRKCNIDAECGGLRCDPIRRQCICLSDDDCTRLHPDSGLPFCNNFTGMCVADIAGCKSDLDCLSTAYCDDRTRACKPRKTFCQPCSSDRECGGDTDNCVFDDSLKTSFCGTSCTTDADCCKGQSADCADRVECHTFASVDGGAAPAKQCWPKQGRNCRVFLGCTPDSKKTCTSPDDCADPDAGTSDYTNQICDPGSGMCVARIQVCPFGQVCDPKSKTCVDACTSDADCIAISSNLRCISRTCEAVGDCAQTPADPSGDKSCPGNKVCSLTPGLGVGTCVPFCTSDQECPPGNLCSATSDGRRKCQAGCRMNSDCSLDRICKVPVGSVVGACANSGKPQDTCQSDMVCAVCGYCNPQNQCVVHGMVADGFCRTCGSDNDCSGGHCLTLKGGSQRCGQPCPIAGCPRGFTCTEICVNGVQNGYSCSGTTFAECVPVDQSCLDAAGAEKCLP